MLVTWIKTVYSTLTQNQKDKLMFNELMAPLKSADSYMHASAMLCNLGSIIELLGENYIKDKNIKNAVIDSMIATLENHKVK